MGNFNRGSRPGGGRGFERRSFNSPRFAGGAGDRGSRGPVQMHQAVCDHCHKDCEVPFRPTSGKPVFCSSCFENNRDSDSRPARFENRDSRRPSRFEEKRIFEAVCDECKNSCKVPFQPSGGKPVYCSNCFGEKKGGGERRNESSQSQYQEQFEVLNNKLDRILAMLIPNAVDKVEIQEETAEPVEEQLPDEQIVNTEEVKAPKKKSSKKK